jgi:broad specificity phosphatase PhoE
VKIFFVRHGEGLDDLYNEYGGWSDRPLSPKGIKLAFDLANEFSQKDIQFDIVLTSPLRRAHETAQIMSEGLKCRLEDCAYLKERNTYGLLSGVNKDLAKREYPNMVKAYQKEDYIPASEHYSDFKLRTNALIEYLRDLKHENVICVSHGYLITTIMDEYLKVFRKEIKDGSVLEIELSNNDIQLVNTTRLSYVKDKDELVDSDELRKFNNHTR